MGLQKIIGKMLMEIARHNGNEMDTEEQTEAFLKRTKPKQIRGGFVHVVCIIACPCGNPVTLDATPAEMTDEQMDAAAEALESSGAGTAVKIRVEGAPDDAPTQIATNIGATTINCLKCDRRFLAAWEFDACSVSTDVPLPWADPEVPDQPASELSFAGEVHRKRMVH